MNKLLVYVVDIVFVNPIKIHILTIFPSPNNEFLISCLELGAAACISACILACNAAYFVLLASTFALASSLPFKSESAVSA
jgi:hypothetical protein